MPEITVPPNLEDRFLEPEGWRWHHFKSGGKKLRFGSVFPKDKIPDAIVVCLPGLSEYCEKYFETAHDMLNQNYAFWVFDWMGQGLSDRYLPDRQRRHSKNFQQNIDDLHELILGYIKHSSVHPDRGRIPLVMLAHSMGCNIGLHYLNQHPDIFECAAFSAPLIGINALKILPAPIHLPILETLSVFTGQCYVPGGRAWSENGRTRPGTNCFSSDPQRNLIHDSWLKHNPALQVGNATYGWLYQAALSCSKLQKPELLESIQTHCIFAVAGKECLVNNAATKKAAGRIPHSNLIEFPTAGHEILMEKDEIRNTFLKAFHQMIKERVINRPETLKPF